MNELFPIYTLKNECQDCYRCVRECEVKAIKIKDAHASVVSEKCISCGKCVKSCPSNAKRIREDLDKAKNLLKSGKKVIVSLAPAWVGAFDYESKKMIAILKKLGFFAVSETALGAQEVSIKTAQILNEAQNGLFISSACPAMVDYITYYRSELSNCITKIASPALTHAKMLKNELGEDIEVVFIGPCIAKKNESDRNQNLISASLTFEELNYWIKEAYIDVENIKSSEEDVFTPQVSYEGALYPIEGGMNKTIEATGVNKDVKLVELSSIESFENAVRGIDPNNMEDKIFIEALFCNGGCINGPCISSNKSSIKVSYDIIENSNKRDVIPKEASVVVEKDYAPNPVLKVEYSNEEIINAMKKIGKHNQEDELNCGGCGYPTCRDLAGALISGEAEPSMCLSYMRKIAMRKAAAMLRCMPSAMVMVDNDLKIVEANESFIKMFCADLYEFFSAKADGITGAAIDKIIDFSNIFTDALKSGKDIHKDHYPTNKRLYDISVFIVEPNALVGAIITDVTQSELNREKIASKAQEVITKNISVVQDIACLLGEHMVETELLLASIAQDYEVKNTGEALNSLKNKEQKGNN